MTYQEIMAKAADWLGVDLTSGSERFKPSIRGDVVNMILADLCRSKRLRWCQKTTTISLTTGNHEYPLPSDWVAPSTFQYYPAGSEAKFLDILTAVEFDARYPDSGVETLGLPQVATIWGQTLIVKPKPNDNFSLKTRYFYQFPALTEVNNTNLFTENAWDVLLFGVLANAAMYGIEDARVPLFEKKYQALVEGLIIDTGSNRRSGGMPVTSQEPG